MSKIFNYNNSLAVVISKKEASLHGWKYGDIVSQKISRDEIVLKKHYSDDNDESRA